MPLNANRRLLLWLALVLAAYALGTVVYFEVLPLYGYANDCIYDDGSPCRE